MYTHVYTNTYIYTQTYSPPSHTRTHPHTNAYTALVTCCDCRTIEFCRTTARRTTSDQSKGERKQRRKENERNEKIMEWNKRCRMRGRRYDYDITWRDAMGWDGDGSHME